MLIKFRAIMIWFFHLSDINKLLTTFSDFLIVYVV